MKTKKILTLLSVAILSTSAVYAQKVEVALVDEHPVINCEGMPSATYTTTSKGNTLEVIETKAANETLYKRFAVHKSNNSNSSLWPNAHVTCFGLGAGWRLPTQRELMLMWVLKRELEQTEGFSPFSADNYWSATNSTIILKMGVHFSSGKCLQFSTSSLIGYFPESLFVRCIRELP